MHITPVEKEKLCSLFLSREPLLTLHLYLKQTGSRMNRILVVDDDPHIREVVQFALDKEGFGTIEARNGVEALERFETEQPDLMVLDITMPELDGTEVCRRIRQTSKKPIIFLSSRDDEIDRVLGLELGGDDYITKPFAPKELIARMKAILRRSSSEEGGSELRVGELVLEIDSRRVMLSQKALEMGPTEFKLLHFFMAHPERAYSRAQLLDRVWGANVYVEERTVDVHIRRLRKALQVGDPIYADLIQTVRGTGYRFSPRDLAVA